MENSMIGMLLVAGSLAANHLEVVIVKHYGKKHGKGGKFFNVGLLYKEKFSRRQLISAFIGIVAVVLMNVKI